MPHGPTSMQFLRPLTRFAWYSVCFALTLELCARLDDRLRWGAPMLGPYSNEALVMRDSVAVRGRPGFRYEKWGMNAQGFRGPELSAADGRLRVFVVGASETFGLFESEGAEYPARLNNVLDSLAPGRYQVVNAGLPGMSPAAMIPYLRHVVAPLKPDIVVLYPSPSFFLENTPPPEQLLLPAAGTTPDRRVALRLPPKVKLVVKKITPTELQLAAREAKLWLARSDKPESWVWKRVPEDRMATYRAQLERVLDVVDAIGAHPVLVTHSNRFLHRETPLSVEDREDILAVISSYFPRATPAVIIGVDSAANREVRQLARRREAGLIETEGRIPPDASHFADYAHFTDQGADRMARLIAESLLSLGVAAPTTRASDATPPRTGSRIPGPS